MPLARYQIRNEYSLSDPELYRAADKDDPEALLEGVAMAGLVGVLRQLGDLAQFAAEIFHGLHEEVMVTAARGHGLMARVQQLEAEVPSLERAFLSQTHHSSFFSNGGVDWHPNLRSEQNLITREDLPRFVMDSYEECRGPPRLFLLDKFDVAGAGACLKRYTDPSFFKLESASSGTAAVTIHREKRIRKVKQKKAARLRNGETPEVVPSHAKLHQLLLEERIENAYSNPARLVKLKKRQLNGSAVESKTGKSYMEKFLVSPSLDYKMVREPSILSLPMKPMSEDTGETGIKILEISTVSPVKRSLGNESTCLSPNEQESKLKPYSEMEKETDGDLVKVHKQIPKAADEVELAVDVQKKLEASLDGYHSDDNYLDALTTMELELETDNESRPKIHRLIDSDGKGEHQLQAQFSYSQSFGDSTTSDETSSSKHDRNDEHIELQAQLSDSQSTGTSSTLDETSSFKGETNEEHMELQSQFSDSQSVGNSSVSKEVDVVKNDRSYLSHSDNSGIMVENEKSEPILLPSFKHCEYEIKGAPSNHLPQIVESPKPDCNNFNVHYNAESQEEEISDSRQDFSSSCLKISGHTISHSDPEANLSVSQPTGTPLVETTSDPVELHSSVAHDDDKKCLVETTVAVQDDACRVFSSEAYPLNNLDDGSGDEERKSVVQPIAAVPDALSTVKDDACTIISPETYPLNNLDDGERSVQSDTSLQSSNELELAPAVVSTTTELVETPSDPVENHSSLSSDEEMKHHGDSVAAVSDTLSVMKEDTCPAVSSYELPLNNLDEGDPCGHFDTSLLVLSDSDLAPDIVSTGTELAPVEPIELRSSIADDEERKCHVESMAVEPDALSVTEDDACPVVSSEECTLNNVNDNDSHDHFDASLQSSNELNLAHECECSDQAGIKVLQDGFPKENSAEILVSSAGVHTIYSFVEEEDSYPGSTLPLEGLEVLDSKAESCNAASQLCTEDQSSAVETTPASSLTREQFSDFTNDSSKDELGSAGFEVLYSGHLSNFEEKSGMDDGKDKSGATCSVDAVEDDGHLKHPSSPDYVGQGDHVNANDVFTEKVQSKDQDVSAALVDGAENFASTCPASDLISSSSSNLANLSESLPGSSDSHHSVMEPKEEESNEIFRDSNAEKRNDQLELSPDKIPSNIIFSSMIDPANFGEHISSIRDPRAEEMEVSQVAARQSSTELEVPKEVDQPEVACADLGLGLNGAISQDFSDSETSSSIHDPSLKLESQCTSSANCVTTVPEPSELGTQNSECDQTNSWSPSSNKRLGSETSSEQFFQLQAGQQDAGFVLRDKENFASEKLHYEHMHVSDQLEQERNTHDSSTSPLEMHADQPSSSESLLQSAGNEINSRQLVLDSLKPVPNPFSVASEINLGEMPPMPPLPPMQWRRAKAQHSSLASQREVIEVSQASFQPMQTMKTDEKGQFGLVTSERETLQYPNPFLPVMAVESDKIQYSSGFSVGIPGHPVAVPLQFPFMVNEANGQYNYLVLERGQIQNPFFTLPVVSTGMPAHGYIVPSEGEMAQNSNPCPLMPSADSLDGQEKLTQPPSQPMAETNLEDNALEHSLSNLEGEQEDSSVNPIPAPSMETVQPNHNLRPWDSEMDSSLDITTRTPEFEAEKPNGIPKIKLPRPRNPLIDAVAAHDKSKLRKVTPRVQPETASKIDERDSLLEQIRTKSFNLKPAAAMRPSIQGPKTNLKVAAILEKANAIRQALAGSDDEDDDADSWSE